MATTTLPDANAYPKSILGDAGGLTKREFIASQILSGMLVNGTPTIDASAGDTNKKLALKAVEITELLIQALNGTLTMS